MFGMFVGQSIYKNGFHSGYRNGLQENIDRELLRLGVFEISECVNQ